MKMKTVVITDADIQCLWDSIKEAQTCEEKIKVIDGSLVGYSNRDIFIKRIELSMESIQQMAENIIQVAKDKLNNFGLNTQKIEYLEEQSENLTELGTNNIIFDAHPLFSDVSVPAKSEDVTEYNDRISSTIEKTVKKLEKWINSNIKKYERLQKLAKNEAIANDSLNNEEPFLDGNYKEMALILYLSGGVKGLSKEEIYEQTSLL